MNETMEEAIGKFKVSDEPAPTSFVQESLMGTDGFAKRLWRW